MATEKKFDASKVELKALDAGLKVAGLNRLGTKEDRIKRMTEHFATAKKADLILCDVCGGLSTEKFSQCPFCGTGDPEPEAKKDEPKGKTEPKADKKDEKKVEPKGKSKLALAEASKALSKYSVADLDKSVGEIVKLQRDAIRCTHSLGVTIKDNFDKELWKLRVDPKGGACYQNVREFWRNEFGYSHTYCYQLMDIAAKFSQDDVEKVGPAKLHLIMQAPEAAQPKLLESARKGEQTVDQLKKAIDKIKDRTKGTSGPKATEKSGRVTVGLTPGRKTLPMLSRVKDGEGGYVPAKKIEDNPWLEYELSNSMRLRVVVSKNPAGELVAVVEFKRYE